VSKRFWQKLSDGEPVLGLCVTYPAAGIVEGMCKGWDWVWVDMQHGQHDYSSMLQSVRAADVVGVAPIVRPATHDPGLLGKYCDTAPTGLLVPMVNTAEQAREIARAVRFPPVGMRSFGGRRPVDLYTRAYYQELKLLVMLQIETEQGAREAEGIIQTEGVDALFFGPDDMKVQLGHPVSEPVMENKVLRQRMAAVAEAARKAGKHAGTVAADPDTLRMTLDMGYQVIACGSDIGFMRVGAQARLEEMREVLGD